MYPRTEIEKAAETANGDKLALEGVSLFRDYGSSFCCGDSED